MHIVHPSLICIKTLLTLFLGTHSRSVGQNAVEEVNVVPYDKNYDFGWSAWEGKQCTGQKGKKTLALH